MCQVYYGIVVEDEAPTVTVHPLTHKPSDCWRWLKARGQVHETLEIPSTIPEKPEDAIRFVCMSDTHGQHEQMDEIPAGDVLLHTGDFSMLGNLEQIERFNDFLGRVKEKFKMIIVIAGNHDLPFDEASYHTWSWKRSMALLYWYKAFRPPAINYHEVVKKLTNCVYLQDSGIEFMGYKIYGSPWQPTHWDLAFNLHRGTPLLDKWRMIPDDTDILLTHGPPLGHGDITVNDVHVGCSELLSTVQKRVRPLYHVFGHIHEGYGMSTDGTTKFINASICTVDLAARNRPIVFDLPRRERTEDAILLD